MKKGLTMLVAAMVIFALVSIIGSAAATAVEAAPISSVATITMMIVFGIMTIGVALYEAMNQKKGHTRPRPGRSAKALSSAVVLAMIVANAQHTRKVGKRGIVTPKIDEKQYTLITIPDE